MVCTEDRFLLCLFQVIFLSLHGTIFFLSLTSITIIKWFVLYGRPTKIVSSDTLCTNRYNTFTVFYYYYYCYFIIMTTIFIITVTSSPSSITISSPSPYHHRHHHNYPLSNITLYFSPSSPSTLFKWATRPSSRT